MKTSCYHHKTVARPPREARKPPSLGVVTDKRWCCQDRGSGLLLPLVLVCRPQGLCFAEQREEQRSCLARVWQGEQRKGAGLAGLQEMKEGRMGWKRAYGRE